MKRRKLTRRQLAGLPPGPLYRDIHPDREPVCLYGEDGEVAMETDQPSPMMRVVRQMAKKRRVCPAVLLISILQDAMDKRERGF